jgi:hypothetical protein
MDSQLATDEGNIVHNNAITEISMSWSNISPSLSFSSFFCLSFAIIEQINKYQTRLVFAYFKSKYSDFTKVLSVEKNVHKISSSCQ